MSYNKTLHIKFKSKLNKEDTEYQTYGCRANNPDICKNIDAPEICAFVRNDGICKKPSTSWKKQYHKLLK